MFEFIKYYLHLCIVGWPFGVGHAIAIFLIYHGWWQIGLFFLITIIALCTDMILKEYAKYDQ